jgi:hypothetical protein
MKTTVNKAFAKVVGAGLLAGALAVALPGAAQAQSGFSVGVRVGQPAYYGYNGYVSNGYGNGYNNYYADRRWDDRWHHDDRRDWDRHDADRRHFDDHRDHFDDHRR